jgi:hypothetical protein
MAPWEQCAQRRPDRTAIPYSNAVQARTSYVPGDAAPHAAQPPGQRGGDGECCADEGEVAERLREVCRLVVLPRRGDRSSRRPCWLLLSRQRRFSFRRSFLADGPYPGRRRRKGNRLVGSLTRLAVRRCPAQADPGRAMRQAALVLQSRCP